MYELIENKANYPIFSCQSRSCHLLLRTCPGGEIGRHRGFKIPRPQSVPVRVRPRAPFSNIEFGATKNPAYAGFFMPNQNEFYDKNIITRLHYPFYNKGLRHRSFLWYPFFQRQPLVFFTLLYYQR